MLLKQVEAAFASYGCQCCKWLFHESKVISVWGSLSYCYYFITSCMCTISARLCYEILFLLSVIEKFIDQCETKMTDIDPSIVGQHVQPLKNNYFKAWAGSSYYLLYMQMGYYLSYMQQDFWICHWKEKHKVQFQCSFSRASRIRNLGIYFFVHLITCLHTWSYTSNTRSYMHIY